MINTKTGLCGLLGHPVEHSASPSMHNAAFKELGLNYIYLAFDVGKNQLGKAVGGLRALNVKGFNVTIPHKVDIIHLLDGLDPLADKIQAVNTIVNNNGKLIGYNTDASGFLEALIASGFKPEGKKVALLGAGGGARAIAFILAQSGANLSIINRRQEYELAVNLATSIALNFKIDVSALELNDKSLKSQIAAADLLINATPLGMFPDINKSPVPAVLLHDGLTVFDIVYNPLETMLMKEAKQAGARTVSGLDMLVRQGALAFKMWTGRPAPLEVMKKEALKALKIK
ncbi:MAG: shikimate dehydrogenase [Chloroflexi bacterium]|nr:shikimate dehydrogenase [Chloroflexota bacterium]